MKKIYKSAKEIYGFDFEYEKTVYKYLCMKHVSFLNKKKLARNNNQYKTYREWKNYISQRYEKYSRECLINYSRFLNLCIQRETQNYEVCSQLMIVIFSVLLTNIMTQIMGLMLFIDDASGRITKIFGMKPWLIISFVAVLFAIIVVTGLCVFTWHCIKRGKFDLEFLKSYKNVIDEVIL